jgi:tetratricopeptide (TPR) repeat protein
VILSTIVDVQPGHAPAHRRLGYALRDLGDYSGAIRQFEEVARLRSDEPEGLQEIVVTHLAQGDFAAAKARHAELIAKKWDPRFGDVGAAIRSKAGSVAVNAIDAARKSGDRTAMTNLRRWFAELGVPEAGLFDIKIIMKWDADSDVDLDVTEPGGETVNHNHARSQIGAVYPFDNTTGRGPEHYTLLKAPRGRYRVGVHLHGSTPSVAEVEVILFEETPRERRLKSQVRLDSTTSQAWPLEFDLP